MWNRVKIEYKKIFNTIYFWHITYCKEILVKKGGKMRKFKVTTISFKIINRKYMFSYNIRFLMLESFLKLLLGLNEQLSLALQFYLGVYMISYHKYIKLSSQISCLMNWAKFTIFIILNTQKINFKDFRDWGMQVADCRGEVLLKED